MNLKIGTSVKTDIHAGDMAEANKCYFVRDFYNLFNVCWISGGKCYPQNELKICLAKSGEKDWWTVFPEFGKDLNKACEFTKNYGNSVTLKAMGC